ncbi:MAG TPA: hypothetical protein VKU19_30515 [Bryobacteraceae bacterium]|nr:hypothetical protein [Bryobacteraceae bacterium]
MGNASVSGTAIFWALAILPGLLHPFLLLIYFIRFRERKTLIDLLLNRSTRSTGGPRQSERARRKEEWQGRIDLDLPTYLLPTVIASLISIAAAVVMVSLHDPTNQLRLSGPLLAYTKLATPAAVAGFAGAYVWGLSDFVDRFRILSLPASSLHMIWFRMLLGPVLGGYAQQLIAKDFAPVLVFALASIPVPALLKWMQDIATQRFAIGAPGAAVPPQWELVQGLTPDIVARLNEAGVTSTAHLGNQDPVSLLRKTNIEWRNILDMMDQAYLASYVGTNIDKLRARGIRGAIEMAIIWQRLTSTDTVVRDDADSLIKSIAVDLGKEESGVRNLIQNLWEDPQVERIWSMWYDRDESEPGGEAVPDSGVRYAGTSNRLAPDPPAPNKEPAASPANGASDRVPVNNGSRN